MPKIRLDKYLADMQIGTRSQVKEYIKKKKVTVNGIINCSPDTKIDIQNDKVTLNGKEIGYSEYEYFMLNKPQGVLSASRDKKASTVIDLISDKKRKDLFPVGRLDIDTEGLLFITNDGQLAHNLLTPKKHVNKCYFAVVKGKMTTKEIELFKNGIQYDDELTAQPALLEILSLKKFDNKYLYFNKIKNIHDISDNSDISEVYVTIHEGKFHQIKKMFQAVNSEVLFLKRISMGNLKLDENLKPGEYRELTDKEIKQLYELTEEKTIF